MYIFLIYNIQVTQNCKMQCLNKMPSFGDDTLSACIQAEVKDMDITNNCNDTEKCFKDDTFLSKVTNISNNIDKDIEIKGKSHSPTNRKRTSSQNNLKCKELKRDNVLKSKLVGRTSISKSKSKNITSSKENHDSYGISKKNANVNVNYINNISSNTSILPKQYNKSESSTLHADNSNEKSNVANTIPIDTSNVKLSDSNILVSNKEKSSKLNASISIIPTQERNKLASWGLPPNILQVNLYF